MLAPQANFLASPPSKHARARHIPHLPGPLHRVSKRIFFDASCSVPESRLSPEGGPGAGRRHCVVLRHVDQKTGVGKGAENRVQSCAGAVRKVKEPTGKESAGDTTAAGKGHSRS